MSLDYFQNPDQTTVCFLTYDVNIHFYNLPTDPNGEPTILWVGDVNDPFVPYPREKLMLKVVEDREKIDIFLDKLVTLHYPE
jgi:Sec23/Sec24 trunk domain